MADEDCERCVSAMVNGMLLSSDGKGQEEVHMGIADRCDGLAPAVKQDSQEVCSSSGEVRCNQETGPKRKASRGFTHQIPQCLLNTSSKGATCDGHGRGSNATAIWTRPSLRAPPFNNP
jgi:hypothetical protein